MPAPERLRQTMHETMPRSMRLPVRLPIRPLLAAALAALAATPAHATQSLSCAGVGTPVAVELTLGTLPILAVVGGRIATPSATYALSPQAGEIPVIVGQAFGDAAGVRIDFTDPNVEAILVSLRTVRAEGDKQVAEAGVLLVEGVEAFAVTCDAG